MKNIKKFLLNLKEKYKSYSDSIFYNSNHKYIFFNLILLLLVLFYNFTIIYCNFYIRISYNILCYCLFVYIVYSFTYHYVNLQKTILSALCFFVNFFILSCFFYGFIRIFITGITQPIYVENLSIYAQWRYPVLVIFCLCLFLLYYLFQKKKILQAFELIKYPHMQDEIRRLIDALFYNVVGDFFKWVNYNIINSNKFRFLYFFIIYFVLYLYKFFFVLLFINFSFFHGDLRFMLYWLPLSFLLWLFSFYLYHHIWFIQGNLNSLKALLEVTYIKNTSEVTSMTILPYEYKLTEVALSKGYTDNDYSNLITLWHNLSFINQLYNKFNNIAKILSLILFLLYFSCWCYLSYLFFIKGPAISDTVLLTYFSSFWHTAKRSFHATRPLNAPWDARALPEPVMNKVTLSVYPMYSPGHYVYGELQPDGSFLAFGSLTTKPLTTNTSVIPIPLPTKIRIDGQPGSQYIIPFKTPQKLHAGEFNPNAEGVSHILLELPNIKALLDFYKNQP